MCFSPARGGKTNCEEGWVATVEFVPGGYRYIPAVFQYSGGVVALPGFEIRRFRFRTPVPLKQGFERIEKTIRDANRPLTAFCACELRSPIPFNDQGFHNFNETYVVTLEKWGLYKDRSNPVARSNVCPEIDPPSEPSFHAFSFTVAASETRPTFVIAGSAEAREGSGPYSARTVRFGEATPDAIREKARFVLDEMARRLSLFGLAWADTTATHVYTVHDFFPFLADDIMKRGAARAGLSWHFCRPPVQGLEFEMDCRAVGTERVI
jgi:hypothetical protein